MCDWFQDLSQWKKVGIISVAIGMFISFFLIGFSVTVLEPLNYGLEFDENARSVDTEKLYTGGRYFTGLGYSYLEFPRDQQILVFSNTLKDEKNKKGAQFTESAKKYNTITARTKEGLKISIEIFVGYQLTTSDESDTKVQQLWDIYQNFGDKWDDFLNLVIQSVVRDTMMAFEALQFPQKRFEIGNMLKTNLETKLKYHNFKLIMANIVNISFPSALDAAITQTEIVAQKIETIQFTTKVEQILKDTAIEVAELDGEMDIQTAKSDANIITMKKEGIANVQVEETKLYADALEFINSELGYAPQQALDFLWIYGMQQNEAKKVVIGTKQPI